MRLHLRRKAFTVQRLHPRRKAFTLLRLHLRGKALRKATLAIIFGVGRRGPGAV